jgi:type-IV secretion system protein TraC
MLNTSEVLQIWGIHGDFVLFKDATIGFGLNLKPIDISCQNDESINGLQQSIMQFLNSLPPSIYVQFVATIDTGNENVLDQHRNLVRTSSEMAKELINTRLARLSELDQSGCLPVYRAQLLIRKNVSDTKSGKKIKFNGTSKGSEKILELGCADLRRLKNAIEQNLSRIGIQYEDIDSRELLENVYEFWNPCREINLNYITPDYVRDGLLFTDLSIGPESLRLGKMCHRILSLKNLPEQTFAGMASILQSLPFGSRTCLSIQVSDQQKELAALQTQRRLAFSMVTGKTNGVKDLDSEAKLNDLESLLEEMVASGEQVFKMSLNVILKAESEEELGAQVSETLMRFRDLGGAEGMQETLAAFPIFAELAPPNARCKERQRRLKTTNLADFLPLYGPWTGHKTPRVLLRSRSGNLVKFDPFDADLTNANQLVSGGSGAGKSFLTNCILLQMLKEDPKVFIVDIGGSYKKLMQTLDGQYIDLGLGNGLSINPFDLKPGETEPDQSKIKFLVSLIEIMCREEGANTLPRLVKAEVEQGIISCYQIHGTSSTLSMLRDILLKSEETEVRSIGKILRAWTGKTPYGSVLDAPTNVELADPIVCFDLKGMESHPDLQAISLFVITDLVWRAVQADRSTKKFIVMDECWKLLENASGSAFIGEVFRTVRKYNTSAIAISQSIDDFAKSKVASAILPNSAIKWIMSQRGADLKSLKEVLALNDNEISLIESLTQKKGEYSEAFLMSGTDRSVIAIDATPLEYWICTTDARDLGAIQALQTEQPTLSNLDCLKTLAEQYPQGVAKGQQ